MSTFVNIIFFVISFGTLAVAGGFATDAARRVTTITGYDNNDTLISAHKKLSIAAVVTWITVAALIVIGILLLVFGSIALVGFLNWIIYGFLILTLVAIGIVGVLSAMASAEINRADVQDNNLSRRNAAIAAVLAIVGFVGVVIIMIIRIFSGGDDKEEEESGGGDLVGSAATAAMFL